jgi:hypothetical protein
MTVIVTMHKMIIENEQDEEVDYDYDQDGGEELRPEVYHNRDPFVLVKDWMATREGGSE